MTTNELILQITSAICVTVFLCVFILALYTDVFNKRK